VLFGLRGLVKLVIYNALLFSDTSIIRVRPPISGMIVTETCKKIHEKIKDQTTVILQCHGVPGSGKSEIIRKLAEDFPFKNEGIKTKSLIKWHIQCKDSGHDLQQELKLLVEELLKISFKVDQDVYENVVENLEMYDAGEFVKILVEINVPVLIIVEDPPTEDRQNLLRSLCKNVHGYSEKQISKMFHVYISSRQSDAILTEYLNMPCYNFVPVPGFNKLETIMYLNEGQSDDTEDAVVKIFEHFNGLPIAIRVVKAYCIKVKINYEDYFELVEDAEYEMINENCDAVYSK